MGLLVAGKQSSWASTAAEPSAADAHVAGGVTESRRGDPGSEEGQALSAVSSGDRSGLHQGGTASPLSGDGRGTEEPAGVCNEQGLSCAVNVSVRLNMPPPFTAVPTPLLSAAGHSSPPSSSPG